MDRRQWRIFLILICVLAALACQPLSPAAAQSATFAAVRDMASSLARKPYQAPGRDLPVALSRLNYDAYRAINYRRDRSVWHGQNLPFDVEFYHRGYIYLDRVTMNAVDSAGAHAVDFSPDEFDYRKGQPPGISPELGFAGIRILHPATPGGPMDELMSFLGASYFRVAPADGVFGASARGIAIDTSAEGRQEEFPGFRQFWIVKPAASARQLVLYALLDGSTVTGAYQFEVNPGDETVINVQASLFVRKPGAEIGLAPLTSMFFYGENGNPDPSLVDRRPEVHDSDGLLLATGTGEWLWRPLNNPRETRYSSFQVGQLAGFGLLQRDRDPRHYLDIGAIPEKRPSIWVEPQGSWPPGHLKLMELASGAEGIDNIVAQYVLEQSPPAGREFSVKYRLRFFAHDVPLHAGGRVIATRVLAAPEARFSVDFDAGVNAGADLEPVVTATGGSVDQVSLSSPDSHVHRVTFVARPAGPAAIELRVFLRSGTQAASETWSESWRP